MTGREGLAKFRLQLTKKYGGDAIVDLNHQEPLGYLPTGFLLVDWATVKGGFPMGRIVELYGEPSSGKTSMALSVAAGVQQQGKATLFLDFENAFDPDYARQLGLDPYDEDTFLLISAQTLEQGMGIAEQAITSEQFQLVIVDSVAAMLPRKELEGEVGDANIALQARAIGQEMRRLVPLVAHTGTCFVFLNHLREVIGGFNPSGAKRTTTPGGSWIKHGASLRLEFKKLQDLPGQVFDPLTGGNKRGAVATYHEVVVTKHKLAPPRRRGRFYLELVRPHHDGELRVLLDLAIAYGLVKKSGSAYAISSQKFRGVEATLDWLRAMPGVVQAIRQTVQEKLDQAALPEAGDAEAEEE